MIIKVSETIKKYNMIPENSVVVAGVSGGSDSMAMLYILNSIKDEFRFELKAAHVNHGIRGAQADRDEKFVVDYCKQNGISCKTASFDVVGEAQRLGKGLEEVGREVRYKFFSSFGEDAIIATAHNLSDKTETFLFNFTRGSTLRGLCSIPATRGNIIRPLIECSKSEIERFCSENAIPYVTDCTNTDTHYARNRIRHNVITELKKINPSFESSALRCMDSLKEDDAFLRSLAADTVEDSRTDGGFDVSVINKSPMPVKKRALIRIIEETFGVTPEYDALNSVCRLTETGGKCEINGGIIVRVRAGKLEFPKDSADEFTPVELKEGINKIGDKLISAIVTEDLETINSQFILKEDFIYYLNYDKIQGKVVLRSRKEGDKINLRKRGCTKTLKKLFNEKAISPERRNEIIVAADDNGVLFVEGIGIDSRVEADKSANKVLILSFLKRNGDN